MNCATSQAWLQSYIEGDLTRSEADQVRAHLHGCPDCHGIFNDLLSVIRLLEAAPELEPPVDIRAAVRGRLAQAQPAPVAARTLVGFPIHGLQLHGATAWVARAAVLALLVGILVFRWPEVVLAVNSAYFLAHLLWATSLPLRSAAHDLALSLTQLAQPLLALDLALLLLALSATQAARAVRARMDA